MKQILVFILFAAVLCWTMFTPIYKHVLVMRQAHLQKEVDYLLEVGASGSRGYIDQEMIGASRLRLEKVGFNSTRLNYTVGTTDGSSGSDRFMPVTRGVGLHLTITYPYEGLFMLDKLIGIDSPGSEERMGAYGIKMSEFVP
ncbi:hypothetical protein [Paenibacillus turpanensis]|uniref:hypothetical protein n=1 Tax=Paenibacillus turpanensis TaxID=2689078 RepID=UPI00140BB7D6|nr:hypothetical protein [Paenibacillus turpanensis]